MSTIEAESLTARSSLDWRGGYPLLARQFPTACRHLETWVVSLGILASQVQSALRTGERFVFSGLWLFIASVSAFDTYLTVRYSAELYFEEINPVARYLLHINDWEPSLLIGWKFMGTFVVLGFVAALYTHHRRLGLMVTSTLASLQMALLGYLTCA
ncbi:MAG: hypothetical protein JSS02_05085 [Planctomycetes bacterium]|nr:hypothetical protein [Planctomycetota bacterium]